MNVAVVPGYYQHRAWRSPLQLFVNTENEEEKAACTIAQVFDITRPNSVQQLEKRV